MAETFVPPMPILVLMPMPASFENSASVFHSASSGGANFASTMQLPVKPGMRIPLS